jgi:L-rhamnose mutarotase
MMDVGCLISLMARVGRDEKTRAWNEVMRDMQVPLDTRAEGEWWANMEEVFHLD